MDRIKGTDVFETHKGFETPLGIPGNNRSELQHNESIFDPFTYSSL